MLFFKNKVSAQEKSEQAVSSDKVFLHSVTVSVISILLCLVFLSASTWAWFNEGVSSSSNVIQAGQYKLEVSVAPANNEMTEEGYSKFSLQSGVSYTVTLTSSGSGGNGYARIWVDQHENELYYTNLVPTGSDDNTTTFTLIVSEDTDVYFDLRWGRYSGNPAVVAGGIYVVADGKLKSREPSAS